MLHVVHCRTALLNGPANNGLHAVLLLVLQAALAGNIQHYSGENSLLRGVGLGDDDYETMDTMPAQSLQGAASSAGYYELEQEQAPL